MNACQLSNNTKTYLNQYQCILKNMIKEMSCSELTDSISGSFITQMIPHHRAAIAMSENLLCYTTYIPLQNIAHNIITSQQKSIEYMTAAYTQCRTCINSPCELESYREQNDAILCNMFYEMNTAPCDNNIDTNFIQEMVPHHKGAVFMSENALRFSLCTQLVPQLREIIRTQEEGIRKMQIMLQQLECCSCHPMAL